MKRVLWRILISPWRLVDALVAALVAVPLVLAFFLRHPFLRRARDPNGRRLVILDTSYSLATIRARGLDQAVRSADLDGFFDEVWRVHPLVGASSDDPPADRWGRSKVEPFAPRIRVLEAHAGLLRTLRVLPLLNFVLAQSGLAFRLDHLIRGRGVDAVRAGEPYYTGLMGLVLARLNRIPLVLRISGNYDRIYRTTGRRAFPRLFPSRQAEKWVERRVLGRADLVVAPNRDNRDFAVANGARSDRTAIFPYGNLIHPIHFTEPSERANIPGVRRAVGLPGHRLLAYVGRLEPAKHADHLIEVLARVRKTHADAGLVLVGDGSLRAQMEARAETLGIRPHVAFLGNQDQAQIASLMPSVSATVAPHMGRALAEAALGGTPIVAYDIDWHSELVETDVTGVLVPYPDRAGMADAVARILGDEKAARRMGAAARRRALELMDPAALQARERQIYARLLGLEPGGRRLKPRSGELPA